MVRQYEVIGVHTQPILGNLSFRINGCRVFVLTVKPAVKFSAHISSRKFTLLNNERDDYIEGGLKQARHWESSGYTVFVAFQQSRLSKVPTSWDNKEQFGATKDSTELASKEMKKTTSSVPDNSPTSGTSIASSQTTLQFRQHVLYLRPAQKLFSSSLWSSGPVPR